MPASLLIVDVIEMQVAFVICLYDGMTQMMGGSGEDDCSASHLQGRKREGRTSWDCGRTVTHSLLSVVFHSDSAE